VTTATHRSLSGLLARPAALSRAFATNRPIHGWVLACTALMPILLTAGWLIADTRQPGNYSPLRQTVSVMSGHAGTDRWIVTGALYIIGVAYFLTAYGLTAVGTAARVALIVAGVAAIGVASQPQPAQGSSTSHVVCTGIGAIAIAIWPMLDSRRDSPALGAVGLRTSIVASVVSVVLFCWTAIEIHGNALGLAERVSSSLQVCWPFVIAFALRRATQGQAADSVPQ
jgi:hypothetical protein